jgi:hypothetical protein
MTTTTSPSTSAELVRVADPRLTARERKAVAGFLAGHSGPTRAVYTPDLRQYMS